MCIDIRGGYFGDWLTWLGRLRRLCAEDPGRQLVELQSMSEDLENQEGQCVQVQEEMANPAQARSEFSLHLPFVLFRPSGGCTMPSALGKGSSLSLIIL